ncbi:MAG: Cytochrome c551/c552 [uncultured Solirubrobacteraceae bacterium]|uniref:Cytochrome c551/c552 n=1 Tax=uncultured Solirubrobacteraceae bacterium TaxID=1162706 RepID=A0A6J4TBR8_9ACTN|nr:MAG: Cytochrome c551/c552 [uncultured Solirubrobacteraceae bacterium]
MKRLLALATLAVALGPLATAHAITLPPDFSDELVATIPAPVAIAFTPDGRMLVASKDGALRVRTASGNLLTAPALDLGGRLCSNSERGLLGVAVDPAFAVNRFVYVYYTFNKFNNTCPLNASQTPVNRVARFVLQDSNVIDPATERVLVDNISSYGGNHNAGDVQFGKDGNLYVSVGDGGCDYAGGGCAAANDAAREERTLLGKILRITPAGDIPPDNPFAGDPAAARCNTAGGTTVLTRCQETFAWGLRNPFRIAFNPNAAGTRFYINDVGQNEWEEIDDGLAAADYGWNVREGHCATGSRTNCGAPPAGMTNPIFAYGRSDGCGSITGGAFVPAADWPPSHAGTYLFGDYVCGRIFQLVPDASGGLRRVTFADGLGASSAVHLAFGPRGAGRALYYTTYRGGGEVRRIAYTPANRTPAADVTASPSAGATPLSVAFDGSGSSDPDPGDTLTYVWDFGDGATAETSGPTTSHTYTVIGTYTATLRVRDNRGSTSPPDTVRIDAGNTPPVATIQSPAAGQTFAVGETILLRGTATDAQQGTLAPSALSWTVLRRHGTHTHPYLGPLAGNASSLLGPPPEDLAATTNSSIEVQLTATDAQGAESTQTRVVMPMLADVSFASQPVGLTLTLNDTPFTTPHTWTSWVGWNLSVAAPDQGAHRFSSWSDGGGRAHDIQTPPGGVVLTATFAGSPALGEPAPEQQPGALTAAASVQQAPRPACVQPRSRRVASARLRGSRLARARVVATTSTQLGRRARTRYRVMLTRRCSTVATGYVRGRRLVLTVKPSGTRTIMRNGRRVTVTTHPRLAGAYLLRPSRAGPRVSVTTVRFGA